MRRGFLTATVCALGLLLPGASASAAVQGGVSSVHPSPGGEVVTAAWRGDNMQFFSRAEAVFRFTANGQLDRSLSGDGRLDLPQDSKVAVQRDGKIIVANRFFGPYSLDLAVRRYRPNGRVDRTFATRGAYRVDSGLADYATGVAVEPDGDIVVVSLGVESGALAGYRFWEVEVRRLNSRGKLERFGHWHFEPESFGVTAFAVDQGRVTFLVQEEGTPLLFRLNRNLRVDRSFSDNGERQSRGSGSGLATADGLTSHGGDSFGIRLYESDGSLDPAFSGTHGATCPDPGARSRGPVGRALTFDPEGHLLALGGRDGCGLVRFTQDAHLDRTFGENGFVDVPGASEGSRAGLALGGSAQILVGLWDPKGGALRVRRYTRDGQLDAGFGVNGIASARLPRGS